MSVAYHHVFFRAPLSTVDKPSTPHPTAPFTSELSVANPITCRLHAKASTTFAPSPSLLWPNGFLVSCHANRHVAMSFACPPHLLRPTVTTTTTASYRTDRHHMPYCELCSINYDHRRSSTFMPLRPPWFHLLLRIIRIIHPCHFRELAPCFHLLIAISSPPRFPRLWLLASGHRLLPRPTETRFLPSRTRFLPEIPALAFMVPSVLVVMSSVIC
jgi:hypothetical protein